MKKLFFLSSVLLLSIPGCGYKKTTQQPRHTHDSFTQVDIPTSGTNMNSYYDDEVDEFASGNPDVNTSIATGVQTNDFTWVAQAADSKFNTVYFDFNSFQVRADQEDALDKNVQSVKDTLCERRNEGKDLPTIVIEGHACHSAGSSVYNLALSEKRAKVLRDRLVASGVPAKLIKIVGRGQEMPVIADGKQVNGDRTAQWPNRRDEIRLIYS